MRAASPGTGLTRRALATLAVTVLLVAGLLGGVPATAATPNLLGVTLSEVTLSAPDPSGTIRISGSVTNRSQRPLYSVRVDLWHSTALLRTPAAVADALRAPTAPAGQGGVRQPPGSDDVTGADAALAPSQSATFTVSATLKELALTRADASYWVGVTAGAATRAGGDASVTNSARTLITLPGPQPTAVASIIELSSQPRQIAPNLFTDDGLIADIATRLDVLADAAALPGYTYALDPALVAELTDMADGYQVLTGATPTPGTGQDTARTFLAKLRSLPANGYATSYALADPQLGTAREHAALASRQVGLALAPLPPNLTAERPATTRVTGALAGQQVNVPATLVARLRSAPQVRWVRTTDDLVTDRLATPDWAPRRPLADVLPLLPASPTEASPPADADLIARLEALSAAVSVYGAVAPASGAATIADAQYARGASEWWAHAPHERRAFLDAVDARLGRKALRSGITLDATPRFSMSANEALFPVTLTNRLRDEATVRIAASTDQPQRIRLEPTEPIVLRPGATQTVNLAAKASANGVVTARVHAETLDGRRLTHEVSIIVETTNLGLIGWVIVGVSGAVLVATTAWRIRQLRTEQGKVT